MTTIAMTGMTSGYYGDYGGQFVPQILMAGLHELEEAFEKCLVDQEFMAEYHRILADCLGRPTPLTYCANLSVTYGAQIYLKGEDLLHGGAYTANQVIGQALLAKRMGKTRVIAETATGQHGIASALACALLGLQCTVYMGAKDCARQQPNLDHIRLLGAHIIPVTDGAQTLKEACNAALRQLSAGRADTHYLPGTATGPHPYPRIVKEFQRIIGAETKRQTQDALGGLPDAIIACVGGGSNAIGIFADFLEEPTVDLIGVQAAGAGLNTNHHSAPLSQGSVGVLHGTKTFVLQDDNAQISQTHSILARLPRPRRPSPLPTSHQNRRTGQQRLRLRHQPTRNHRRVTHHLNPYRPTPTDAGRIRRPTSSPRLGISRPHHIRAATAAGFNGVIIGSALIQHITDNIHNPPQARSKAAHLMRQLKPATIRQCA